MAVESMKDEMDNNKKSNLLLIGLMVLTIINASLCVAVIAEKNKEKKAIAVLSERIERYNEKKDSEGDTGDQTFPAGQEKDSLQPQNNREQEGKTVTEENNREIQEDLSKEFYAEPVSEELQQQMNGKSYKENPYITYDDLRHVVVRYIDFDWNVREGELIVNKTIADDVVEIFKELYRNKYQIEKIQLVDVYQADDDASMADNNTSAFNYRTVDGTEELSDHGYGLAIDINPLYNPYVRTGFGDRDVLPVNGKEYADRTKDFAHKIEKGDVCYQAFVNRGFKWGGEWDSPVDYQHFYKER